MSNLVEVRDIAKQFTVWHHGKRESVRALSDVSLAILPGQTVGLVGESGSGKSTLGNVIAGFESPTSGHVWYRGLRTDVMTREQRRHFRRNVQVIWQDPVGALNPRYTVRQLLAEPFRIQDATVYRDGAELDARIRTLLDEVELSEDLLARRPGQLSGGQCQRIGLARAMALRPDLMILDESLSALDASVQATIVKLLKQLQVKYQMSYLFITHDIRMAEWMSEQLVVMHQGRIVAAGDSTQVLREAVDPYVSELRNSVLELGQQRFLREGIHSC